MSHIKSVQISIVKKSQPCKRARYGQIRSGVSSAPAQALGAGLGGHSSLRRLWLFGNRIGDSGLQALWSRYCIGPDAVLDIRLRDGKIEDGRCTSARGLSPRRPSPKAWQTTRAYET